VRLDRRLPRWSRAAISALDRPAATSARTASASMEFQPLPFAAFALVGAVPAIVVGLRIIGRRRAEEALAA
jgi:hypothetical protein